MSSDLPDRSNRLASSGWILALIGAVITLAIAVTYCFFAPPYADDFSFARRVRDAGVWAALDYYRDHENSRFTGLALVFHLYGLIPLFSTGYAIALLLLMGLTWFSFHLLSASVTSEPLRSSRCFLLSVLAFATYWNAMPLPGETFYWLPDATQGHIAIFFFSVVVFLGARTQQAQIVPRIFLSLPFAVLFALTHELYTLLGGFCVVLILAYDAVLRRRTAWYWAAQLPVFLAGFFVISASAGTIRRMDVFHQTGLGLDNYNFFLRSFFSHIFDWAMAPSFLALVGLLYVRGLNEPGGPIDPNRRKLLQGLLGVAPVGLALAFLGFTIAAGRIPYPFRVLNILFCAFLWWGVAALTLYRSRPQLGAHRALRPVLIFAAGALYFLTHTFAGNTASAIADLKNGVAGRYFHSINVMNDILAEEAFDQATGVHILGLPPAPRILPHLDLQPSPDHWRNLQLEGYYRTNWFTAVAPGQEVELRKERNMPEFLVILEWLSEPEDAGAEVHSALPQVNLRPIDSPRERIGPGVTELPE